MHSSLNQNKKTFMPQELSDVCCNSLKDNNKIIYLEKILNYLKKDNSLSYAIWDYNGIPLLLLQEVISPYFILNTPQFTKEESSKVCVVLDILEILVQNNDIKKMFIDSKFQYYLYRYITIYEQMDTYESVRIATLKVIVSLIKNSDMYVQTQLKNTEIVPLVLKNIDIGSEAIKLLSIDIFYLIIRTEEGLNYSCQTFDRFSAINQVFNSLAYQAVHMQSSKLIEKILRVYIRLCAKNHIRNNLNNKNPENVICEDVRKLSSEDPECCKIYNEFINLINKPS